MFKSSGPFSHLDAKGDWMFVTFFLCDGKDYKVKTSHISGVITADVIEGKFFKEANDLIHQKVHSQVLKTFWQPVTRTKLMEIHGNAVEKFRKEIKNVNS